MTIIYDFLFFILALGFLPYLVLKKKFHRGFWTRLGFFPGHLIAGEKAQQPSLWIHAVSVGEVHAVKGLTQKIKQKFPGHRIVLSTVTSTGYSLAASQLKEADTVLFAPLDFSFIVRKYIRLIRPRIYISVETEIWPNLFWALNRNSVPIVLVNGRISQKALSGYLRFKFFFKKIFQGVSMFCMQSQYDAERILKLGISAEKVRVAGNLKFDDLPSGQEFQLKDFGFKKNETIWIAGSTHPGEEEIVLKIFKSLAAQFRDLRLIIAPRHIERTNEVVNLVGKFGFQPVRLSELLAYPRTYKNLSFPNACLPSASLGFPRLRREASTERRAPRGEPARQALVGNPQQVHLGTGPDEAMTGPPTTTNGSPRDEGKIFGGDNFGDSQRIIIVDTIGHLKSLYSLSRIVFVGKSLSIGGGQNIIEPAFFGNAVVVGPLMQNFKDIVEIFLKDQAVLQVKDAQELEEKIKLLLAHPAGRDRLGQAAQKVIEKYQGATEKSLQAIEQILTDKSS